MNKGRPISTLARFAKWQVQSRLQDEVVVNWIDGAKLAVRRGMTAATANIYCGLREYVDMRFVLDTLKPGDVYVDIGANVGAYSVLASKVRGVDTVAVEADPQTAGDLRRNIKLNGIGNKVHVVEAALGASEGTVAFTRGLGAANHVLTGDDAQTQTVPLKTLDSILENRSPTMIKIDVEGYEYEVIKGASRTLQSESLLAIISEDKSVELADALGAYGFSRRYYDPETGLIARSPAQYDYLNALFVRDHACVEADLQSRIDQSLGTLQKRGSG